jgi:hypothetical protein
MNNDTEPQIGNGRWLLLAFVLLGCIGAGVTWWWNWRINQLMTQSIQFWGKDTATVIRQAPELLIYELGNTTNDPAVKALDLPQGRFAIKHEVRANQSSILVHLRYLILSDDQYDWSQPAANEFVPNILLEFIVDSKTRTRIAIDSEQHSGGLATDNGQRIRLRGLDDKLKKFIADEVAKQERQRR